MAYAVFILLFYIFMAGALPYWGTQIWKRRRWFLYPVSVGFWWFGLGFAYRACLVLYVMGGGYA